MKVRTGDVVCVSKLALGERRAELHAGGAIAVDMESVWLAGGAGGRPFGVVRVVLDSPSHELMRPQALAGALRAARALRRVAAALNEFSPAEGQWLSRFDIAGGYPDARSDEARSITAAVAADGFYVTVTRTSVREHRGA